MGWFLLPDFLPRREYLAAWALILLGAGPAWGLECPTTAQWNKPAISTVAPLQASPRYHHHKSISDLGYEGGKVRQGQTRIQTRFGFGIELESRRLGRDLVCYRLKSANAIWEIVSIDVFIAFEHVPGTCTYTVTMDHENQHVALAQQNFVRFLPRFERVFRDAAERVKPFATARDGRRVSQDIMNRLEGEVAGVRAQFDTAMKRENAILDSPQSYRELEARCPKWPQ